MLTMGKCGAMHVSNKESSLCRNIHILMLERSISGNLLMTEGLEQASQWLEMYGHDLEIMNPNPGWVEVGSNLGSTSVLSCTRTKIGKCISWFKIFMNRPHCYGIFILMILQGRYCWFVCFCGPWVHKLGYIWWSQSFNFASVMCGVLFSCASNWFHDVYIRVSNDPFKIKRIAKLKRDLIIGSNWCREQLTKCLGWSGTMWTLQLVKLGNMGTVSCLGGGRRSLSDLVLVENHATFDA